MVWMNFSILSTNYQTNGWFDINSNKMLNAENKMLNISFSAIGKLK